MKYKTIILFNIILINKIQINSMDCIGMSDSYDNDKSKEGKSTEIIENLKNYIMELQRKSRRIIKKAAIKNNFESTDKFKRTPFLNAAYAVDLTGLKRCIQAGCNIYAKDKHNNNALDLAKKRQEDINNRLIKVQNYYSQDIDNLRQNISSVIDYLNYVFVVYENIQIHLPGDLLRLIIAYLSADEKLKAKFKCLII